MIGTIGHLFLITAFLSSALSGVAYFLSTRSGTQGGRQRAWATLGRASWGVSAIAAVGATCLLVYLLFTNQYQYAYVYQHVANDLSWYFTLSAFWEGQEGSFLLWIFYTGLVGLGLIAWTPRDYEAPVMTVVAACQFFLVSMIVGLPLGPIEIGETPFSGLPEAFPEAPIFQPNPDYVPADGQGLNELLKNWWMAVHPPTLFLGFALMTAPFAFAVAALWKRRYTQWVRPALPWALGATMVLGAAIAMGGYWAYETLSFGGFWAWDPVENASLVPWILGLAAIHAMLIQKKSGRGHKAALLLSVLAYIFVVYESFLTRSGILGEISVHSFVDLGLYNQLLIWMAAMAMVGFGLFAYRYKDLPTPDREARLLSREFLIFSGALLLCAIALVITVGTSAPILGRLFRDQPSAVPTQFYDDWTLPLAIGVVFLAGLGQLFWWHKMTIERVNRVILRPIALSVASTVSVLFFTPFVEHTVRPQAGGQPSVAEAGLLGGLGAFWAAYGQSLLLLLLVFVAFFALYGNGYVLWRIGRGNPRMAGGALAHVGLALMILGIAASHGMNNPLGSIGPDGSERDYFVLHEEETRRVEGYTVRYTGKEHTGDGRMAFPLEVEGPQGRSFTMNPVAYKSGDQWFQHPDIRRLFASDLFAAVSPRAMQVDLKNEEKVEGASAEKGGEIALAKGDSTVIGNGEFAVEFVEFDADVDPASLPDSTEMAVAAVLDVTNLQEGTTRRLRPVYIVKKDRSQHSIQTRMRDWGLALSFVGMNVDTEKIHLAVEGAEVEPEDWVVVQAAVKPFINVVWLGIILLTGGFLMAIVRRIQDLQFWRRRGS